MGISTKKGDRGKTSLLEGRRVSKDHILIKACAQLDEVCSLLGLAKTLTRGNAFKKLLESIQKDLYAICAEASAGKKSCHRLRQRIGQDCVSKLEREIRRMEGGFRLRPCFTLISRDFPSAVLDVARARCRSAEISAVTLKRKKLLQNHAILIYLNRLSDLLYLLSRVCDNSSR